MELTVFSSNSMRSTPLVLPTSKQYNKIGNQSIIGPDKPQINIMSKLLARLCWSWYLELEKATQAVLLVLGVPMMIYISSYALFLRWWSLWIWPVDFVRELKGMIVNLICMWAACSNTYIEGTDDEISKLLRCRPRTYRPRSRGFVHMSSFTYGKWAKSRCFGASFRFSSIVYYTCVHRNVASGRRWMADSAALSGLLEKVHVKLHGTWTIGWIFSEASKYSDVVDESISAWRRVVVWCLEAILIWRHSTNHFNPLGGEASRAPDVDIYLGSQSERYGFRTDTALIITNIHIWAT